MTRLFVRGKGEVYRNNIMTRLFVRGKGEVYQPYVSAAFSSSAQSGSNLLVRIGAHGNNIMTCMALH